MWTKGFSFFVESVKLNLQSVIHAKLIECQSYAFSYLQLSVLGNFNVGLMEYFGPLRDFGAEWCWVSKVIDCFVCVIIHLL